MVSFFFFLNSFPHQSSRHISLLFPISPSLFFSLLLLFFQQFSFLLTILLPHYSHVIITINLSPCFTLFLPIFFSFKVVITLFTHFSSIQTMFCLQKNVIVLFLYFNGFFFFSYNFALGLWVFVQWWLYTMDLNPLKSFFYFFIGFCFIFLAKYLQRYWPL